MADERLIEIIEDRALMEEFIVRLSWCIKNDKPIPDYIPCLSNDLVIDSLGIICEKLKKHE